jgi:hypothetical protein
MRFIDWTNAAEKSRKTRKVNENTSNAKRRCTNFDLDSVLHRQSSDHTQTTKTTNRRPLREERNKMEHVIIRPEYAKTANEPMIMNEEEKQV